MSTIKVHLQHCGVEMAIDTTPDLLAEQLTQAKRAIEGSMAPATPKDATEPEPKPAVVEEASPGRPCHAIPRYRSQKVVRGARIKEFTGLDNGQSELLLAIPGEDGEETTVIWRTRKEWADRFQGDFHDLGYYVEYEDGYASWSPTEAFENGHTRID